MVLAGTAIVVLAVLQTAGILHAHAHAPGEVAHRHAFVDDGHHFGHADDLGAADDVAPHLSSPDARLTDAKVLAVVIAGLVLVMAPRDTVAVRGPADRRKRQRRRGPPSSRRLAAVAVLQV